MSDLSLEPLAAQVHWQFPAPVASRDWEAVARDYLEALAGASAQEGVIGHIKALALLPDAGYVRASAVSAKRPADVEVKCADAELVSQLTFTVNVLVYGLPYHRAQGLVVEIAEQVAARRGCRVAVIVSTQAGPSHEHG